MEPTLNISVVDDHRYKIAAPDGKNTFKHIIQRELSASIPEDMRLLRWKATGFHDPGDALLIIDVGRRISSTVFPPENREDWKGIVQADTNRLTVRVSGELGPWNQSWLQVLKC